MIVYVIFLTFPRGLTKFHGFIDGTLRIFSREEHFFHEIKYLFLSNVCLVSHNRSITDGSVSLTWYSPSRLCHQDLVFRAWKSGFQNFAWIEKVGIWLEIVAYYTIEMSLKLCITLQNKYCSYCNYMFIGVGTENYRICHFTDIVHYTRLLIRLLVDIFTIKSYLR